MENQHLEHMSNEKQDKTCGSRRRMFLEKFWTGINGQRRFEAAWKELGGSVFDTKLVKSGAAVKVQSQVYKNHLSSVYSKR